MLILKFQYKVKFYTKYFHRIKYALNCKRTYLLFNNRGSYKVLQILFYIFHIEYIYSLMASNFIQFSVFQTEYLKITASISNNAQKQCYFWLACALPDAHFSRFTCSFVSRVNRCEVFIGDNFSKLY